MTVEIVGVEKLDEIVNYAWETHKDNISYPKYKNKNEMRTYFERSINRPEDTLLAVYENGGIAGVLNLFVEKKNSYLQSIGVYVHAQPDYHGVYRAFIDYISERYKGFEMFLGYSGTNTAAIELMESIGAERIEASADMRLEAKDFIYTGTGTTVEQVTPDTFAGYAAFHDERYQRVYWTAERLSEKLSNWRIYTVSEEQSISGGLFMRITGDEAEVYGMSANKAEHAKALLSEALQQAISNGTQKVVYMVDGESEFEKQAVDAAGFLTADTYVCYRIVV